MKKRRNLVEPTRRFLRLNENELFVVFGFQHFTAAIEAVRADVMTHVRLTRGLLGAQLWRDQEVVRAMHAAFGRGFFVLLNSHDDS